MSVTVPLHRVERVSRQSTAGRQATALALRGVRKTWRGAAGPVLDGLDLSIEPGSVAWVGGSNGAGKTTMLRVAAGLIAPEAGSIEAFGVSPSPSRAAFHRLVSFLPAGDRGLYARLTVRRQLEFAARIAMLPGGQVPASVDDAIADFDLGELAGRRVDRISMGQRQRVRLAMTFMSEPSLVLLDEPLTSLDEDGASILHEQIEQLCARGGSVLWCSPSGERPTLALDSAHVLEHGTLVAA